MGTSLDWRGTTALGPLINLIPGSLSPFGKEAPVLDEIHQAFSAQPILFTVSGPYVRPLQM